jgi:metallo-beta-lactamase family protein
MASAVLQTYRSRIAELDADIAAAPSDGQRARAHRDVCVFCTAKLKVVSSVQESRAVQESQPPAIVISSSGMATGGRVLHHLAKGLPDARNTVLFVGFQAVGTRGRLLKDGAKYSRIHGQDVPVAARIEGLDSMSSHADSRDIMRWLGQFSRPPALTCLVHGEPVAMDALKDRITRDLNWTVKTPAHQERIELDGL